MIIAVESDPAEERNLGPSNVPAVRAEQICAARAGRRISGGSPSRVENDCGRITKIRRDPDGAPNGHPASAAMQGPSAGRVMIGSPHFIRRNASVLYEIFTFSSYYSTKKLDIITVINSFM